MTLTHEPCPNCAGKTATVIHPDLTHAVLICLDCGGIECPQPHDDHEEDFFVHNLPTNVNRNANPGIPNLGNGDRH